MIIDLNFKSPAALAPSKRGSLSFQILRPGIDFSFPALKILDSSYIGPFLL